MSSLVGGRVRVNWPGVIFDGLALAGNWFLFDPLIDAARSAAGLSLAFVLLGAVAAQLAGALLKRGPLATRLLIPATRTEREARDGLAGCLTLAFLIPVGATTLLAFYLLPGGARGGPGIAGPSPALNVLALAVTVLTAYALYRAITPNRPRPWKRAYLAAEVVGNALILASAVALMALFWHSWSAVVMPQANGALNPVDIAQIAGSTLFLVLVYAPARALLLVEDVAFPFTWLRIWLVTLPLAVTALM